MPLHDDADRVARLVALGSNPDDIRRIQALARKTMAEIDYVYPRKSCAALLSHFLREAGIAVPVIRGAQRLADHLRKDRQWTRVEVGGQRPGDVGVCYSQANDVPGADHVYLVIDPQDADLMIIVDNQKQGRTHTRYVSGKGRTPTEYFLRAGRSGVVPFAAKSDEIEAEVPDEPTDDLPDPQGEDSAAPAPGDDSGE